MHSRSVSPQPAQGLTCSSLLPLFLQQFTLLNPFSVNVSSDKTWLFEILFSLSCLFHSHCPRPDARKWGPASCQRESYSWKALSHSCSCSHDLRRRGRERGPTWLNMRPMLFSLFQWLKLKLQQPLCRLLLLYLSFFLQDIKQKKENQMLWVTNGRSVEPFTRGCRWQRSLTASSNMFACVFKLFAVPPHLLTPTLNHRLPEYLGQQ